MIFVYSTFPSKKEAEKIGSALVRQKLAACVNIFSIESMYWGKSKLVRNKETAMIVKTKKQNFRKVEDFILRHHSYDAPCIIEIPIGRVVRKYLNWLSHQVQLS